MVDKMKEMVVVSICQICDEDDHIPLSACCQWWQNFMNHILETHKNTGLSLVDYRDGVFTENNVVMVTYGRVAFTSKEHYDWFLLKWT